MDNSIGGASDAGSTSAASAASDSFADASSDHGGFSAVDQSRDDSFNDLCDEFSRDMFSSMSLSDQLQDPDLDQGSIFADNGATGRFSASDRQALCDGLFGDDGFRLGPTVERASDQAMTMYDSLATQSGFIPAGAGLGIGKGFGLDPAKGMLHNSITRLEKYDAVIKDLPAKYRLGPEATLDDLARNAKGAYDARAAAMEHTRSLLTREGKAFSQNMKPSHTPFEEFLANKVKDPKNASKSIDDIYRGIIESSGRPNKPVSTKAHRVTGFNNLGKGLTFVGAGMDAYSLGSEINKSLDTGDWDNTGLEAARIAGGWTGAWAGAKGGAATFAGIGSFIGGPVGTAVGGFLGGIGGGLVGYWGGGELAEFGYEKATQ